MLLDSVVFRSLWLTKRPAEGEDHWEQEEAISHTKDNYAEPHAEKHLEDVALGAGERYNSQEGREATVEYG